MAINFLSSSSCVLTSFLYLILLKWSLHSKKAILYFGGTNNKTQHLEKKQFYPSGVHKIKRNTYRFVWWMRTEAFLPFGVHKIKRNTYKFAFWLRTKCKKSKTSLRSRAMFYIFVLLFSSRKSFKKVLKSRISPRAFFKILKETAGGIPRSHIY